MKTLDQWLAYIESVHPRKIDLSLERVKAVALRLKLIPFSPFVITVAGTNGKGTTSTLLAKTLSDAGYRVGSSISPHLHRFNERIRINNIPVFDEEIVEAFEKIEAHRQEITLSYFEFAILASLLIFLKKQIEIAILEVGLGGRYDAVNIIDADVAVITNIALDHMEYLGPDRESIGEAKAGIIRNNKTIVFGEIDMPNSIKKEITSKKAKLLQYGKDAIYIEETDFIKVKNLINNITRTFKKPNIVPYNIVTAIMVLDSIIDKFPIPEKILKESVESFSMQGRWQVYNNKFVHFFDVAHNPHGIREFSKFIQRKKSQGKTYAIFSMLASKELVDSISEIQPYIDVWYVAPLQHPMAHSKLELENAFKKCNCLNYKVFNSIELAYQAAYITLRAIDNLLIFGSFHTVAEVQQINFASQNVMGIIQI